MCVDMMVEWERAAGVATRSEGYAQMITFFTTYSVNTTLSTPKLLVKNRGPRHIVCFKCNDSVTEGEEMLPQRATKAS